MGLKHAVLVLLLAVASLSACRTPIDEAESTPRDQLEVAEFEKPTPDDLVNETVNVAILPARISAANLPAGIDASVSNKYSEMLRGTANVSIVADPDQAKALIDQQMAGASNLYSGESAVEFGKIAQAKYVGWVEVVRADTGLSSWEEERQDKDGRPYTVTVYELEAQAEVTTKMLNVETGEFEHSETAYGSAGEQFDAEPNEPTRQYYARESVERATRASAAQAAELFPYRGYILETLAEAEIAKCKFTVPVKLDKGTLIYVYRLLGSKLDPVTGKEYREEKLVSKLEVERVESGNIVAAYCIWGQERLRKGMFVKTAGYGTR